MTEQELRAIFGANLKKYRKFKKFTQEELAEKLDISIPFLSDIENSRKWISPGTLVKLADTLQVEPYELLKPAEASSSSLEQALGKWSNEVIQSVTQTVSDIRNFYNQKTDK